MKLHKEINTHSESEVHENSVDGCLAVVQSKMSALSAGPFRVKST